MKIDKLEELPAPKKNENKAKQILENLLSYQNGGSTIPTQQIDRINAILTRKDRYSWVSGWEGYGFIPGFGRKYPSWEDFKKLKRQQQQKQKQQKNKQNKQQKQQQNKQQNRLQPSPAPPQTGTPANTTTSRWNVFTFYKNLFDPRIWLMDQTNFNEMFYI